MSKAKKNIEDSQIWITVVNAPKTKKFSINRYKAQDESSGSFYEITQLENGRVHIKKESMSPQIRAF